MSRWEFTLKIPTKELSDQLVEDVGRIAESGGYTATPSMHGFCVRVQVAVELDEDKSTLAEKILWFRARLLEAGWHSDVEVPKPGMYAPGPYERFRNHIVRQEDRRKLATIVFPVTTEEKAADSSEAFATARLFVAAPRLAWYAECEELWSAWKLCIECEGAEERLFAGLRRYGFVGDSWNDARQFINSLRDEALLTLRVDPDAALRIDY